MRIDISNSSLRTRVAATPRRGLDRCRETKDSRLEAIWTYRLNPLFNRRMSDHPSSNTIATTVDLILQDVDSLSKRSSKVIASNTEICRISFVSDLRRRHGREDSLFAMMFLLGMIGTMGAATSTGVATTGTTSAGATALGASKTGASLTASSTTPASRSAKYATRRLRQ